MILVVHVLSSFIWVSYEKPSSSYCVMSYFWWGHRGNLKLITLGSERVELGQGQQYLLRKLSWSVNLTCFSSTSVQCLPVDRCVLGFQLPLRPLTGMISLWWRLWITKRLKQVCVPYNAQLPVHGCTVNVPQHQCQGCTVHVRLELGKVPGFIYLAEIAWAFMRNLSPFYPPTVSGPFPRPTLPAFSNIFWRVGLFDGRNRLGDCQLQGNSMGSFEDHFWEVTQWVLDTVWCNISVEAAR